MSSSFNVAFSMTANALSAIQQAVDVVQNNTVNANTPGYAAQVVNFSAQAFDPSDGLMGGVGISVSSSQNQYLQQAVETQTSALGFATQQSPLLSTLQNAFSTSGTSGISGAFSGFASSFATLAGSPNDSSNQATAIQAAASVAQAFNQAAEQVSQVGTQASEAASSDVTQVNSLTTQIASLNAQIQNGAQNDAGVAADLNNALVDLSQLVNISVSTQADGTATVTLDGQTALVVGANAYALTIQANPTSSVSPYPNGNAGIQLVAQDNTDVTAQATGGSLGGALAVVNQTVPYYLGSQTQQGELNNLAQSFATRVNAIVTGAQTAAGTAVAPLFTYTGGTDAAATLAVGSITPDQLVSGDGSSSNGAATELSDITNPTNTNDLMSDGQTFTGFYGMIAGKSGTDASNASTNLTTQQNLTTQAQNQLSQASGVSLNSQAAQLLSLEQAYNATAKIITVLENLSQTAVNLIPQSS